MSTIPAFDYPLLGGERVVRSVANLTRADGVEFFKLIADIALQIHVKPFALGDANTALDALRAGQVDGAAVLVPGERSPQFAQDQDAADDGLLK